MSTFKLEINCDNAAFHYDNMGDELHRILSKLIHQLPDGQERFENFSVALMDSNGNKVGRAYMDMDEIVQTIEEADKTFYSNEPCMADDPDYNRNEDNDYVLCPICQASTHVNDATYTNSEIAGSPPYCLSCWRTKVI